jgi:hypothetical protein
MLPKRLIITSGAYQSGRGRLCINRRRPNTLACWFSHRRTPPRPIRRLSPLCDTVEAKYEQEGDKWLSRSR